MLFSELASAFAEIEKRSGRLEMTGLLAGIYKKAGAKEARKITYIMQGILAPPYEGVDLGMGERFAMQAVAGSAGYSMEEVEKEAKKLGDLGLVAEAFLSRKRQHALSTREMDAGYVYDVMLRIAKASGKGIASISSR